MPIQGPDSGIPCQCGGRLLHVLDTDPQPLRCQVIRIRMCNKCYGRQTTREQKLGPLRPGTKPIDTVDSVKNGQKHRDLEGQQTFDELLFAES
jgi:hypothetical protein